MRLVNNFEPTSPEGDRQIGQFEQNVSDEFDALEEVVALKLKPTNRKTSDYKAKLGDLVMVDTLGGDVSITLPVSTPRNAGQVVGVAMMSASNICNVGVHDGTATVNLVATKSFTGAIGMHVFYSAGNGWWL